MCYCDENPMVVGSITKPKARVEHRCGECLRTIQPGEHYECVKGVWRDSGASTEKTCADCVRLRDDVLKLDCWCYGQMMDYLDPAENKESAEWFERREVNWQRRNKLPTG